MNISDFDKCVIIKRRKNGRTSIDCKIGLWGIDAASHEQAMSEALHYFQQYRDDGEYSSILGGKSVVEMLMEGRE